MTIDQLRKAYTSEPFIPLEIYLADGRVLPVPHRDFLYLAPQAERTFIVSDDEGIMETVYLLLVVSFKPMKSANTRGRRKAG